MKTSASLRPRKSPVQARSIGMVDVICEATLRVLLKHGYTRMTTTRVADVAGISVGSLYQYFPNKRALAAEVMRRYLADIVEQVEAAIRSSAGEPGEVLLAKTIRAFIEAKQRRPEVSVALRAPLVDVEGQTLVRDAMANLLVSLSRALAIASGLAPSAAVNVVGVIIAAVEGVVSTAVDTDPAQLGRAEFQESVVGLGLGFLMWHQSRTGSASATTARSRRTTASRNVRRA